MSSWVEKQKQEAFELYRIYLAMSLHFREGSGYDFGDYAGRTNASLESFKKKVPQEIIKFVSLNNKLKNNSIRPEEFLLANARKSTLNIHQLLEAQAIWTYENWKRYYGDKEVYANSVRETLIEVKGEHTFDIPSVVEFAKYMILLYTRRGDEKYLETIAWLLQRSDEGRGEQIFKDIKDDIFQRMAFEKARKVQRIYSHLCII